MSRLKELVPPLELCRKIPFLLFEDSVFVRILWRKSRREEVRLRAEAENDPEFAELEDSEEIIIYPAPTLAEIMAKLPKCVEYRWFDDGFYPSHPKHYAGDFADPDPTVAALKLWLALTTKKQDK